MGSPNEVLPLLPLAQKEEAIVKIDTPKYCHTCGTALMLTPSGYGTCPNGHTKLIPVHPGKHANILSREGVGIPQLPTATKVHQGWDVGGDKFRLSNSGDGTLDELLKARECTLAHYGDKLLVLVLKAAK